jgi:hypothetical protein
LSEQGPGLQAVLDRHAIAPGHGLEAWAQVCVLLQVPLVNTDVVELHEDVPQSEPTAG